MSISSSLREHQNSLSILQKGHAPRSLPGQIRGKAEIIHIIAYALSLKKKPPLPSVLENIILKHPLAWKDSSFCLIAVCLSKVGMTFYQTSSQQACLYCLYIPLEILFWHIRPTQPLYHFSCVITMKSIAIYSHWIGQSPGKEALGRVAGGIAAARAEVLCARGAASPAQAAQRCRPRFGL